MKLFALTLALLAATPSFALDKPYPEPVNGSHTSYQVPVSDDLKQYAEFPIIDAHSTEMPDGTVQIRYTLPLDLTGLKNEIVLTSTNKSTDGTYTNFEGPNGAANCDEDSCNVRYRHLKLDADVVRKNLVGKGITGMELTQRMQVVASFSGDPAGIVNFK
jgi:hypothetical protein